MIAQVWVHGGRGMGGGCILHGGNKSVEMTFTCLHMHAIISIEM